MSNRNFIFVSDLHLSEGYLKDERRYHLNEDFFYDTEFANLLEHLQQKRTEKHNKPWRLVINGDFLEFLQVTTIPSEKEWFSFLKENNFLIEGNEILDKERFNIHGRKPGYGLGNDLPRSLWKLERIINGHEILFRALAKWVVDGNDIVIIIGNHDAEFAFSELRDRFKTKVVAFARELKDELPSDISEDRIENGKSTDFPSSKILKNRILFSRWFYFEQGLFFAEHGCQYDHTNRAEFFLLPTMVPDRPYINNYTFNRMIRLSFGSFFVRYIFNQIEEYLPYIDNIKPGGKAIWMIFNKKFWFCFLKFRDFYHFGGNFAIKKVLSVFDHISWIEELKKRNTLFSIYIGIVFKLLFDPKREEYEIYQALNIIRMREALMNKGIIPEDENSISKTDKFTKNILNRFYKIRSGSVKNKKEEYKKIKKKLRNFYKRMDKKDKKQNGKNSLTMKNLLDIYYQNYFNNKTDKDKNPVKSLNQAEEYIRKMARKSKWYEELFFRKWHLLLTITLGLVSLPLLYYLLTIFPALPVLLITAGILFFIYFIIRPLRTEYLKYTTYKKSENYLNKASKGIASILKDKISSVIFGHTHLLYIDPIKTKSRKKKKHKIWEVNSGTWILRMEEEKVFKQSWTDFPFVQMITNQKSITDLELYRWNDKIKEPQNLKNIKMMQYQ